MLGTVYIRDIDINFVFQHSQSNANIFGSHGMEYRSIFYRSFVLFVVCLLNFYHGFINEFLRPNWKAKLKPREIATLPLQEGSAKNIRSNNLSNIY